MTELAIRTDIHLHGLEAMLRAAGERAPIAIARALNRTGTPVANETRRAVKRVLGVRSHPYAKKPLGDMLKRRTSTRKATRGHLVFSMAGFGGGLPLIYYQPREGSPGASFNWLGQRKMIPRTFYLSGAFPGRKRSGISHAVRLRLGKQGRSFRSDQRDPYARWRLAQPKGPGVPEAMSTPQVTTAWEAQAARRLPFHLASALQSLLAGRFRN